jgi:hypothetical protein
MSRVPTARSSFAGWGLPFQTWESPLTHQEYLNLALACLSAKGDGHLTRINDRLTNGIESERQPGSQPYLSR